MNYKNVIDLFEPSVSSFIARECIDERPKFDQRVGARELYIRYRIFCHNNNTDLAGVKAFGTTLRRLGFYQMKSGRIFWCGISLKRNTEIGIMDTTLIGKVSFSKLRPDEVRWLVGFFNYLAARMPAPGVNAVGAQEMFGPATIATACAAGDRLRKASK